MSKNRRYVVRSVSAPLLNKERQKFFCRDKNVLILSDRIGGKITRELVKKLEEMSCNVSVIEETTKDVVLEMKKIKEKYGSIQIILNLCGVTEKIEFTKISRNEWKQELESVFCATFYSLQSVYYEWKVEAGDCAFLTVSNMGTNFGVDGETGQNATSGLLTGFVKAMAREIPDLLCRAIDFDDTDDEKKITDCIWDELQSVFPLLEVSYTKSDSDFKRTTIEVVPQQIEKEITTLVLTKEDTILFIGGGRGILTEFIQELLVHFPVKIIVVGRTKYPDNQVYAEMTDAEFDEYKTEYVREMKMNNADMPVIDIIHSYERIDRQRQLVKNLKRLNATGKQVFYMSCDISDTDAVVRLEREIRQQFGVVTGMINGAGLLSVGSLGKKQGDYALEGILVRGMGIYNLYHTFKEHPLKFWQNVGSVAGRFGMDGQCDYVASCDLATKMSREINRVQNKYPCYLLGWTAWEDVGMAALPEVRTIQESRGLTYISVLEGKKKFLEEICYGGREEEVLVYGSLGDRVVNKYPFIDYVLEQDEKGIRISRRLDISKDVYLTQHTVKGNYVFPAVAHMEMYFETLRMFSKLNRKNFYLKELDKLELVNFVKCFEKNELTLIGDIQVEEQGVEIIAHGRISSDFKNCKGQILIKDREHSRVKIVLSEKERPIEERKKMEIRLDTAKDLDLEGFYEEAGEYIYYGVLYKNINWVKKIADNKYIGEVIVKGNAEIIADARKVETICFPITLDTIGRVALVGLYYQYQVIAVPVILRHVRVYQYFKEDETIYSYVEVIEKEKNIIKVKQKIINQKNDILCELEMELHIICDKSYAKEV